MFKSEKFSSDILNLQDDYPMTLFGMRVEDKAHNNEDGDVPPFYISLNVYEMILHNVMLDSRGNHNLMPKVIMDSLSLDITRAYSELYSFDSRKVKCLGIMKDMVITLT